jgi:integrase
MTFYEAQIPSLYPCVLRSARKRTLLPAPTGVQESSSSRLALVAGVYGRSRGCPGGETKGDIGSSRTVAGTVNAAVISYCQSNAFDGLSDTTRKSRRAILERFRERHGHRPIAGMNKKPVQLILNGMPSGAARNWKKALRGLVDHCLSLGMLEVDPLLGIRLAKPKKSGGFHTWTEEEITRFRERHAPGTKARLALALLLMTGHARGDVVRMGRQHVKSGKLSMRRQKTGVQFDIPVLPELAAELDLHPKDQQLTFLTTENGKPFTAAGFGNWFRNRCDEAGLRHCSAHGLRKAAAVRHALTGATAPELMAWFAGERSAKPNDTFKRQTASGWLRARAPSSFQEQEVAHLPIR